MFLRMTIAEFIRWISRQNLGKECNRLLSILLPGHFVSAAIPPPPPPPCFERALPPLPSISKGEKRGEGEGGRFSGRRSPLPPSLPPLIWKVCRQADVRRRTGRRPKLWVWAGGASQKRMGGRKESLVLLFREGFSAR